MDPDLQNASGALDGSGSIRIKIQRTKARENGPGLDPPGSLAYIKGDPTRFTHLSCSFSFFRSFSLLFSLRTLTLVAWILLRNVWFMAQTLCFIVLNMNPPLQFANPNWGDVDRGFVRGFRTVLVLVFFLFKSFLKGFCMLIRRFTTIDTRCKPWNLESFLEIF